MEDPMPDEYTSIADQLENLLDQAVAEGRLDKELEFWAVFVQGVKELYQPSNPSSQSTIPYNALELPESPQAIKAPTGLNPNEPLSFKD